MRVLVLGATGNLGSRLLSALLARGHVTVGFVRSTSKLPPPILEKLTAAECGDAKSASDIKRVVIKHNCDAIVNTAGLAAMAPWGSSDLPAIVEAVITAAIDAGDERGSPVRVWLLAGLGLLDIPTQKSRIVDYLHIYPEHRETWAKVTGVPQSRLVWSILCPGIMHSLSSVTYPLDHRASAENLLATRNVAPQWSSRFLCAPLIGGYLNIMSQASSYGTALEDNADLIARDLEQGLDSVWAYQKVGTKTVNRERDP
ncbi:hypothetical protein B0O99DRAFT_545703 [Bisporella sp. PMI_857]|nr:hypothetical protein B0O99DRAFT_545703 [Bisporella sp. PMI_857]